MDCTFAYIEFKPNKVALLVYIYIFFNSSELCIYNAVNKCDASCLGGEKVQSTSSSRSENSAQSSYIMFSNSFNRTVLWVICFLNHPSS